MLQIIGWLGCFYLVIKAMEMLGNAPRDEHGKRSAWTDIGAALAVLGAMAFVIMLQEQVDATASLTRSLPY